jgi:hypothetical protein
MTNQQSAELSEPGVGALDDPTPLVTSQLSAIFEPPVFVVPPIRRNQFDTSPLPSLSQRIGIVAAIGNHPFRVLPRPTRGPRDADFGMRGVRKRNFCRRGTFQPNSQRNTLTVSQYHPLRALATLGFTNCFAPFFAGAKLPSKKASSHLNKPSASRAPSKVRHAYSQTPRSSHCRNRRQQIEGDGYSSGRRRHAAPVCRTHRMPSRHARFDAQRRPRLSLLRRGSGNNGPISSHCSSVNSFCRFLMTEAQQSNCLKHKYLF